MKPPASYELAFLCLNFKSLPIILIEQIFIIDRWGALFGAMHQKHVGKADSQYLVCTLRWCLDVLTTMCWSSVGVSSSWSLIEDMSVTIKKSCLIEFASRTKTKIQQRVTRIYLFVQAAVEEGIVAGGGTTLLKLAQKVDSISSTLSNDEQKVGAEIVRRALTYPLKLIANNAGVNGSVCVQRVSLISNTVKNSHERICS